MNHARKAAAEAGDSGDVDAVEAAAWLHQLETRNASGDWFAVDCLFVAVGMVTR
jgi:hypothetical protein